jgi:electron transport complex protein RnfE
VDYAIQAFDLALHQRLGAFVPLIVVNCLILGRLEAFASKHQPHRAALDALGMGAGFVWALLLLGALRELLGQGTLFGVMLAPDNYQPWIIMLLPSGGFFALALWLLIFNRLFTPGRNEP